MSDPVFFLEEKQDDGILEPQYIPPSMGDESMDVQDLYQPQWARAKVRVNGKVQVLNVLVVSYGKYLPWSEWEKAK